MAATILASRFKLTVSLPRSLRDMVAPVLGVLVGSYFTPDLLNQIGRWLTALCMVFGFVILTTLLGAIYFRRVAKYDLTTSFFASVPGGMSELTLIGDKLGVDVNARTPRLIFSTSAGASCCSTPASWREKATEKN